MSQSIWLNKISLNNDWRVCSSVMVEAEDWQQQYEIYNHAESILGKNPENHDLACAVFQLNRAIDFREKFLNKQYNFKKIPGFKNNKQHEIMHMLGIIKPLLKTKLDKIRNKVMHSAEYPIPKLSEVAELTEFTWYFLKSTDLIASRKADGISFNDCNLTQDEEWAEASFDLDKWEIDIHGQFFNQNITSEYSEQAIEVQIKKIKKQEKTTYISGKLLDSDSKIQDIIKSYFAAL